MSTYTPFYSFLTNVTQSQQAIATFTSNHSFTNGEIVSFRVSKPYGMTQMNNVEAKVLSFTPTTITVDVDSTFFEPFIYPAVGTVSNPAMVVPSASGVVTNVSGQSYLAPPAAMNLQDVFDNVPVS